MPSSGALTGMLPFLLYVVLVEAWRRKVRHLHQCANRPLYITGSRWAASTVCPPLVGPYKSTPPSVTVARVGFVANTFRLLFQSWDMEGRPAHSRSAVGLWQEVLPPAFPFTPLQCSRAVAHAQAMAGRDWATECSLFRPSFPPPQIPEEWPTTAWEHPVLSASPRADYLDSFTPFPTADFGILSDGGFSGGDKASQARSFGDPPGYWDSSTRDVRRGAVG